MSRTRIRIPWFLLWSGLFFLSLRPVGAVDAAVDLAVVPLRAFAELASPLAVLRAPEVRAAEDRLARDAGQAAQENERLLDDLARTALPSAPALLRNRRIVHAEVLGRVPGNRDQIEIRLRDPRGVAPGQPVARGDVYVGRVVEVSEERGTARVELVTAGDFHVGARVPAGEAAGTNGPEALQGEVLMTVGGILDAKDRGLFLDVHHPSDRQLDEGIAWVHELFDEAEQFASLADGLLLGAVERLGPEGPWGVVPELDYLDGLFQVVVFAPEDARLGSADAFEPVLMDERWVRARPLGTGDPNPWRCAAKVGVGRLKGVAPGAAVTSIGARLIGRVTHAGLMTADVSFLADPGFTLVAVARFDPDPTPRVLGRLVSEGEEADGRIRFRWIVRVSPGADLGTGARRAHLFSGSGDAGLPAGFRFGEADIPTDAAPGEVRRLWLETDVDPRHVRALFLRTAEPVATGGAP